MSTEKLADVFSNFETRLAESYRNGWDNYWKSISRFIQNPSEIAEIQKDYLNYVSRTAPEHLVKVVEAGVQCYTAVIESGGDFAREMYSRSSTTSEKRQATQRTANEGNITQFTFEGFVGEPLVRQFLVTNSSPRAQTIAFILSDFQNNVLESALILVEVTPNGFLLESYEEKVVTCTVTVPDGVASGMEYVAKMRASGLPSLNVNLQVKSLGSRSTMESQIVDQTDVVLIMPDH